MKTYKLLKDLPTFKAGKKFFLDGSNALWSLDGYDEDHEPISKVCAFSAGTLKKFPNILKEWFEEIEEDAKVELSGQYIPAEGKKFWGMVITRIFGVEPQEIDGYYAEEAARHGLSFKTKEECQKFIDWLKAYQILRQDAKGFEPAVHDCNQYKWHVYWLIDEQRLEVDVEPNVIEKRIYFATVEDAMASIKAHEKEWKIYLGVEE